MSDSMTTIKTTHLNVAFFGGADSISLFTYENGTRCYFKETYKLQHPFNKKDKNCVGTWRIKK